MIERRSSTEPEAPAALYSKGMIWLRALYSALIVLLGGIMLQVIINLGYALARTPIIIEETGYGRATAELQAALEAEMLANPLILMSGPLGVVLLTLWRAYADARRHTRTLRPARQMGLMVGIAVVIVRLGAGAVFGLELLEIVAFATYAVAGWVGGHIAGTRKTPPPLPLRPEDRDKTIDYIP